MLDDRKKGSGSCLKIYSAGSGSVQKWPWSATLLELGLTRCNNYFQVCAPQGAREGAGREGQEVHQRLHQELWGGSGRGQAQGDLLQIRQNHFIQSGKFVYQNYSWNLDIFLLVLINLFIKPAIFVSFVGSWRWCWFSLSLALIQKLVSCCWHHVWTGFFEMKLSRVVAILWIRMTKFLVQISRWNWFHSFQKYSLWPKNVDPFKYPYCTISGHNSMLFWD